METKIETKYQVGDILHINTTDAYWLIEDIKNYVYYFRILDTNNLRTDNIFYIDQHLDISKVA